MPWQQHNSSIKKVLIELQDYKVPDPYAPQRNKFLNKNLNAAGTFKFALRIYYVTALMFYYVYILQSLKNNSLYIGYSSDLRKRLKEHNSGESKATKPFRPYKLIFYEAFLNRIDAKNREKYLKSGYGRRTINKLLRKYLRNISNLAQ